MCPPAVEPAANSAASAGGEWGSAINRAEELDCGGDTWAADPLLISVHVREPPAVGCAGNAHPLRHLI